MSDDPLSIALECAARGWHVFPCNAGKQPLTKHGFKDATTDPERIRYFWEKKPKAAIGVATGASGLVVVDLDVKNGAPGMDNWHDFVAEHGRELEDTTLVETPSGGMHVYYRANGHKVGSTASKLAPGIDTRAEGGYVIAGGSPGYEYVDEHGPEVLATLPAVLSAKLAYAEKSSPLIPEAALSIPEGRRDATLASLAGTMRRRGMSVEAIAAALAAENQAHCKPPLADVDIERIARSVGRYEPTQPAVAVAEMVEQGRIFIDWSTFWDEDEEQNEWVYKNILARGRGHAIYAMHKGGKSLLALYMAAQIATCVDDCSCLYLDYEMTGSDVRERLRDMGYGPDSDLSHLHYALLPTLPALDTEEGGAALAALVDEIADEEAGRHVVVIIDTISRAVWGEENSADTWRFFYVHTGLRLKQRGVTWLRLDHGGKDSAKGQRGSSGKGDDVDVVWKLTPTENGVRLQRELARMSWVPESVLLIIEDFPLCYLPAKQDWPEGTATLANILNRLEVPLDATVRAAGTKLREIDEGRRHELVSAALKWRRERLAERISGQFNKAGEQAGEHDFEEPPGTDPEAGWEQSTISLGNARGNAGERASGVGGEQSPPIYRGTVPHSDFEPIEMGDL